MNLANEFHPVPIPTHKKRSRSKEFTKSTKDLIRERSQNVCEVCKQRRAEHFHHVKFRSQASVEEARDPSNCLHVCTACHNAIHNTQAMNEYAKHLAESLAKR